MNRIWVLMLGALLATGVLAKLPEMTEEQKAAAAEKKAKAAEGDKKAAELLAASQDAVAGKYIERMKSQGVTVMPTPIAPPAPPAAAPVPAAAAK